MIRSMRTVVCDAPECQSYCELGVFVDESSVTRNLADRGWATAVADHGETAFEKHYCPFHKPTKPAAPIS